MSAITVSLPDDLERKFRKITREKYGDKQGRLSKGAVEALKKWCNENSIE